MKDIKVSLVGNKIDLENREISIEEANKLSKSLTLEYYECSAKENKGFPKCVINTATEICKSQNDKIDHQDAFNKNEIKKSNCC